MKASTLWAVWKNLNLWPWLTVLAGGLVILISYGLSNAEGKFKTNDFVKEALEQSKPVEPKLAESSTASPNPVVRSSSERAPSREYVVLGSGLSSSVKEGSGFKELAGNADSSNYISTGSVFKAQLIMPIKTSVQERFVMAQTTQEFRDPANSARRIPKGSRLIGRAQLNSALRGVDVRFTTLVSPKGKEYPIQVIGLSRELFAELNGIFFSNDFETYSTIMAFGFIEGFADASKDRQPTVIGDIPKSTVGNKVLDGVGGASFRVAEDIMRDIRNRSIEYVVVPSGEQIFAVFSEKFILPGGRPIE